MSKTFKPKYLAAVLFFFVFPFLSHAQKIPVAKKHSSENIIRIDLYEAYKNAKSYPLSTVAESVEYLPLETSENCLIGSSVSDVVVTSKEIIVCVYEDKCYRFYRQGKFINSIGSVGRGPKEVTKTRSAVIDTTNRWVYIVDWEKLVKYDFEGNFLAKYNPGGTLDMKGLIVEPELILLSGTHYQNAPPGERFSFHFFSGESNNYISKIACKKKGKIPFSVCNPSMYNYNNQAFINDFWNDTIYRVKDPNNLEAYAFLDMGRFEYRSTEDKSIMGGKNTGEEMVLNKSNMSESGRFIFVRANKGLFFYDKNLNDTYCCEFKQTEDKWHNFENDLTGGPTFTTNFPFHTIDNNTFVTFNDAYEFFEEGVDTNNPKIKKLLQNLQPGDNPVLVLVKLKE